MWDLPGPGIEPVSPELAGGFLTTAPPGKSMTISFEEHFGFCFMGTESGIGTNWILAGSRAIGRQVRTEQSGTISRDLAPSSL